MEFFGENIFFVSNVNSTNFSISFIFTKLKGAVGVGVFTKKKIIMMFFL
jgi:hypothetical protein